MRLSILLTVGFIMATQAEVRRMVDELLQLQDPIPGVNDPAIDRRRTDLDMNEILRRFEGEGRVRNDPARRPQRSPGQVGINPAPQVYLPEVMQPEGGVPWPNADFAPPEPPDTRQYPKFPFRPYQRPTNWPR